LTAAYPKETGAVAAAGGSVLAAAYDWAATKGRCLVVLCWNKGGLHYVYAHDGNVMDPGSGTISTAAEFQSRISATGVVGGIFIVPT
jgi:hypothetical protein